MYVAIARERSLRHSVQTIKIKKQLRESISREKKQKKRISQQQDILKNYNQTLREERKKRREITAEARETLKEHRREQDKLIKINVRNFI